MATALFITEQFIKDNSVIDENLDMKYLTVTIDKCQKKYIRPILGTALYNELGTQINAGTLTALNTTLLDSYIQEALLYYVLFEGISLFTYKITNKSIMKKNSDNSQPIDSEEVAVMRDGYKDDAEYFSELATNYLIANSSSYPLFLNPGNTLDTIRPNMNNFTCGWVLGDTVNIGNIEISRSKYKPYL